MAWATWLNVPRDDGRPFQMIVGGFGRQSEATVTFVFERGGRDANGTTVGAPDTGCAAVEVCSGDERQSDRRLAWAGEGNCRGLEGPGPADVAPQVRLWRNPRCASGATAGAPAAQRARPMSAARRSSSISRAT